MILLHGLLDQVVEDCDSGHFGHLPFMPFSCDFVDAGGFAGAAFFHLGVGEVAAAGELSEAAALVLGLQGHLGAGLDDVGERL